METLRNQIHILVGPTWLNRMNQNSSVSELAAYRLDNPSSTPGTTFATGPGDRPTSCAKTAEVAVESVG